ncbi:hypothetical protein KFL_001540270 [Klebsormidium nitens]|uniref:MYND-type domain-containing protein n=1 Tax=Klebsormidium nitens TaxID=105231 RepID=A0A1Y1I2E6_KLENI|nr:hypothetical protein KFL_001540270 [Klebsormidium nitens]|eukprot:GAQ83609.1 hypothetical protein KFL_001540270 [Klebsormidium nitens]
MMDEDMDSTVERCAALLISDDADQVQSAVNLLKSVYASGDGGVDTFATIVQEIAECQGGSVLWQLLLLTLGQSYAEVLEKGFNHFHSSTLALALLTSSKVVVESYLREGFGTDEKENAREILTRLVRQTVGIARMQFQENKVSRAFGTLVIVPSLECLANFARRSKVFRDAIKECAENGSIFDQYKTLLSAETLAAVSPASQTVRVRFHLASIAVSLAFSADSQMWAIDMGLLKLLAAIYEATPLRELSKRSKRHKSPAFRCNKILLRLLDSDATAEKLLAHNALSGFRPHRRKINGAEPEFVAWAFYQRRFQGEKIPIGTVMSAEDWKLAEQAWNGDLQVPVMCSWRLCAAEREPVVGKGFSKCGRCHTARYCSKEHQKLHWRTHKVHCEANQATAKEGVSVEPGASN